MGARETEHTAIFTCAGGSNTGQTANAAGVRLAQSGWGYLACLAGVGAGAENTLKKLAGARKVVVVDGCSVACARKMLEKAGVNVDGYVQVAELGVKKDLGVLAPDPEAVEKACRILEKVIRGPGGGNIR